MAVIGWTSGSVRTEFLMYLDRIDQNWNENFSVVRIWLEAYNRGNTSTFSNSGGEQVGSIDGIWGSAVHSGTPFIQRGVGTGAQRWRDGPWDIRVYHDGNGFHGGFNFRQRVSFSGGSNEQIQWFSDLPRIPKTPRAPINLRVDANTISTQSFGVYYGHGDMMGAGREQDHAEWSRSDNGQIVWNDYGPNTYTNPAGIVALQPGTDYRVRVRSRNSRGWGEWSGYVGARTLSAARVKIDGNWRNAVPYVKVDGVWRQAQPYQKVNGSWKQAI